MNEYIGRDVTFFKNSSRVMGKLVSVGNSTITVCELGHKHIFEISNISRLECTGWGQ